MTIGVDWGLSDVRLRIEHSIERHVLRIKVLIEAIK